MFPIGQQQYDKCLNRDQTMSSKLRRLSIHRSLDGCKYLSQMKNDALRMIFLCVAQNATGYFWGTSHLELIKRHLLKQIQ